MKSGIFPVNVYPSAALLRHERRVGILGESHRRARSRTAERKSPRGVVVVAHWQLNGGLEGWSPLEN